MPARLSLEGKRYGRLSVLRFECIRGKKRIWRCLCDCGRLSFAQTSDLTCGKHRSCGCLQIDTVTIHGATKCSKKHAPSTTPEYRSWNLMNQRCSNPSNPLWKLYGGRGIIVCDRWRNSFASFLSDMGVKPKTVLTLDRIDTNGHYEPSNCRWVTHIRQQYNKRTNLQLCVNGFTGNLSEVADHFQVDFDSLLALYRKHTPLDEAVAML